jgi:CRP-like cAMP-binding protein
LPPEDLARLWPQFEPIEVNLRHVFYAPDEPVTAVHFPEGGMVSMVAVLEEGSAAEVGVVGSEGMVGLPLLLGADSSSVEAMCQAPGPMLRLRADLFHRALDEIPALRGLLLRYTLAFQQQVSQTAARPSFFWWKMRRFSGVFWRLVFLTRVSKLSLPPMEPPQRRRWMQTAPLLRA